MKTSTEIVGQIVDTLDAAMRLTGAMVFQEVALEHLDEECRKQRKNEGFRALVDSGVTAEQMCFYTDSPHDECQKTIDHFKANPDLGKV